MNYNISNTEGYKLFLTVNSISPIELMMVGYEENKPNTVHFYRQYGDKNFENVGLFQGTQTFEFPFPISPKKLKIKVFDNITSSTNGIKIVKIKHTKLNRSLSLSFKPHVQEFIDFALDFATKCGYVELGEYESKTGLYSIVFDEYVRKWEDSSNDIIFTPARIDHKTGIIEVGKHYFDQLTITNRLMILIHEFSHFYFNTKDETECDILACTVCLKLGFSKTECMYSVARLFDNCGNQCDQYIIRKQKVIDFINNWKNEKNI